ncbi:hypothetical protein [Atopococcus tabaci]|uniref:hypothetical protein n=1 Tax=Atopococcus tabaci TaxID=269774 RepID=UPI000404FD00|nr:hypothetical protein [Atopococcus tabaci]
MKLDKTALRFLALGFFVSAILLSVYGVLSPGSSLSAEEQSYKVRYEELVAETNSSSDSASVAEQPADSSNEPVESTEDSSADVTDSSEDVQEEPEKENNTDAISTVIVIEQGDPSSFASTQLQNQGIVESAIEFNNFLENNNYTGSLRPGSYEVNSEMSFEEIARTLMDER